MRVIHLNNTDLPGRRFNGYDMHLSLPEYSVDASMLVLNRQSETDTVHRLPETPIWGNRSERSDPYLGTDGLLNLNAFHIAAHPAFKEADIAHYHLIHNNLVSMADLPVLFAQKPSVWTIHDAWAFTGGCIYPFGCEKWKTGCAPCDPGNRYRFGAARMSPQMFRVKAQSYAALDADIVIASEFTRDFLTSSPLASHFKRVHKIPFGLNLEQFDGTKRSEARARFGIPDDKLVLAFRYGSEVKGSREISEMLTLIDPQNVHLLCCDAQDLPKAIKSQYKATALGWVNDLETVRDFYAACDIFLMPSLAESFGLMAIEAMASSRPIIVFADTVLTEITFAPACGVAVPYKDAKALADAVARLRQNGDERRGRGALGRLLAEEHYRYTDYVKRHLALYTEILERQGKGKAFFVNTSAGRCGL